MDGIVAKRARIRTMLKRRQWLEAGDKALAREVGVSPMTVEKVRRQMIHAGLIPAGWGYDPVTGTFDEGRPRYRDHAPARGGYVWTPDGRQVRETLLPRPGNTAGRKR